MSIFEHSRTKIFNQLQHPLIHDVDDFGYVNPRLPGVYTLRDVLDYVVSVLYPNWIGTFAVTADLPATANPNDYAVVVDDGDGRSAGYVWSVIDNAGRWIKRYDIDWSLEAVLAEAVNRTQPMYVHKYGMDDRDPNTGVAFAGDLSGQHVYGGQSAGSNLTLNANAGDAAGSHSGFVQVNDDFRPLTDNTYKNGTDGYRWSEVFAHAITSGSLRATGSSITSLTGTISFDNEHLVTTGNVTCTGFTSTTGTIGSLSFAGDQITSSTPQVNFGAENLVTTGVVNAASGSNFGNITFSNGSITDSLGSISFGSNNLGTTGTLSAGDSSFTRVDVDSLRLDGNALTATGIDNDVVIQAVGAGVIRLQSALTSVNQTVTGRVGITGDLVVDNLTLDGATISSVTGLLLDPANEITTVDSHIVPATNALRDLGSATSVFRKVFLSGSIGTSTTEITLADLLALRHTPYRDVGRTQPAQAGDSLFWDAVNGVWLASRPDTEISHTELAGLTTGDAGHTQFVMLSGRAGGQVLQGGTLAGQSLTLESTSDASKGAVYTRDNLLPSAGAVYSGGAWGGVDLGSAANPFRDVNTRGQFRGFRFENHVSTALPGASAASPGRAVYTTDTNKVMLDIGGSWIPAGVSKFISDTTWNGVQTQQDIITTGIVDCRNAIIQLADAANGYERVYANIRAISANTVRITVNPALPAGTYRLIVME